VPANVNGWFHSFPWSTAPSALTAHTMIFH
jgi:hypothetical protein